MKKNFHHQLSEADLFELQEVRRKLEKARADEKLKRRWSATPKQKAASRAKRNYAVIAKGGLK